MDAASPSPSLTRYDAPRSVVLSALCDTPHSHAIVSSSVGPEYYVNIMSFVDKSQLEPGCAVLLHNKGLNVVGVLADDVDPMVSVMKVDKAPTESYADIGGLETQIQEIKEAVELPLTHPELYEDIGIKPPKVSRPNPKPNPNLNPNPNPQPQP